MFSSWGQQPFFGEYDSNGTLLWSAQYGLGGGVVQGYRILRANWTGYPTTNPNISIQTNSSTSSYDVYVSWNGATEVSSYTLLGVMSPSSSGNSIGNATKTGFETVISVGQSTAQPYAYLQVAALGSNGTMLGSSDYVALNGSSTVSLSSSATPASTAVAAATSSGTISGAGHVLDRYGKVVQSLVAVAAAMILLCSVNGH